MKKVVYAYLHTHWDMEWYRDKEDFDIRLVDITDGVLDELESNRAPFFYFDGQIAALLNYLKIKPENKNRILKLVKEKKLAIGPFFVSADTYLVNFISMIKNLEIGLKYSKEFNQKEFIGYICDVFGISNSIFEALKIKNISKAVIWRGVNPNRIKNNCCFIKNGIDTVWLVQGYFNDFLNRENVDMEKFKEYLDKISKYSPDTLLMPIGADHLGILKNANEKINKLNTLLNDYEIILTSPFEYFEKIKFKNKINEKEFLDNLNTYILGGVYSSRIPQKIRNSYLQNKITRLIEPLNFYLKEKYERNIFAAYEILIKNHAHDGICGCCIDRAAQSVDHRFDKCENILNSLERNIVQNFKNKNSKAKYSSDTIGLFNLSNTNNLKTVEIKSPHILKNAQILGFEDRFLDEHLTDIYKIPVTEEITRIYRQLIEISANKKHSFSQVKILKPKKKVKITESSIENDFIKLKITDKKLFLTDKKTNSEAEIFLTDMHDSGDSYNYAPSGKYRKYEPEKTGIFYDENIQSSLEIKFKNIKLYAILDNNSKFLKFKASINNKTKNHKIQLVLKTNKNISNTVSDDAIGVIARKIDFNYKMSDFMPVERPHELKTNSYPMQCFAGANGIYVLTKGLNEYEIYKNELRICLLRAVGTISNPKNPARAVPAGPNLKIPNAQLIGKHEVEFAVLFSKNDKKRVFNYLDIYYNNYIAVEGKYENNIEFMKLKKDEFFYGISEGKKVIYNLKTKKIQMI